MSNQVIIADNLRNLAENAGIFNSLFNSLFEFNNFNF